MDRLAALTLALLGAAAQARAAAPRFQDAAAARAFVEKLAGRQDPTARIQSLIGKLGHGEEKVREAATRELIALGESAVELVARAARSDDPEVRWRARRVLQAPRAAPKDLSADLAQAIDLLAAAGDKGLVPALLRLLGDHRVGVRYGAEYGLRRVTHRCFGYSAYAAEAARAAAAARWRQWWTTAAPTFALPAKAPRRPTPAAILISSRRLGRVWMLSFAGKVLWKKEVEGELSRAKALANGNKIIAHKSRAVVEELDPAGKVVWKSEPALSGDVLDLERLPNGNTVLVHSTGNQVLELDGDGKVVWSKQLLRMPISAQRLPNGNTLVGVLYPERWVGAVAHGRVVEITRSGAVVWAKQELSMPTDAVRLATGNVLITEQGRQRVIELDRNGAIVWERKCEGAPNSARRLPDGTTVINDTGRGVLLVGKDGTLLRTLDATERAGKLSLVPAGFPLEKPK